MPKNIFWMTFSFVLGGAAAFGLLVAAKMVLDALHGDSLATFSIVWIGALAGLLLYILLDRKRWNDEK